MADNQRSGRKTAADFVDKVNVDINDFRGELRSGD